MKEILATENSLCCLSLLFLLEGQINVLYLENIGYYQSSVQILINDLPHYLCEWCIHSNKIWE